MSKCDPLWEKQPSRRLLKNEIEARKSNAVQTAVCNQFFLNPHYFLNILVKFYGVQALRK